MSPFYKDHLWSLTSKSAIRAQTDQEQLHYGVRPSWQQIEGSPAKARVRFDGKTMPTGHRVIGCLAGERRTARGVSTARSGLLLAQVLYLFFGRNDGLALLIRQGIRLQQTVRQAQHDCRRIGRHLGARRREDLGVNRVPLF